MATNPFNITDFDGRNDTQYSPDFFVGVLACADQFQLRNPTNRRTTTLTSSSILPVEIEKLQYNKVQTAPALNLYYAIGFQTTYFSVHSQGANSLRASDTLSGSDFTQIGLPDNQWQIEAAEMFSVSMAKLQQQILSYATGPTYFHQGLTFVRGEMEICERQKIRGISGFLSFSVLGVSIILGLGSLLILTSFCIDSLVGFIRRRLKWKDYKSLQWTLDEKLQLQRLALEKAGQGLWTGEMNSVPITSKEQIFGLRWALDKDRPTLSNPSYSNLKPTDGKPGLGQSNASVELGKAEAVRITNNDAV
ncbi:MAG: hypothetical protein Q9219_007546 [cf. Caloplaca sp. 3 TL-2023]